MESPCFIFKYGRNIVSFRKSYDKCNASPLILFHIINKSYLCLICDILYDVF